jgi:DnaD/phage-associated family protein
MYHEARNDAKLRALTDAQFRVWFNLLCLASEKDDARGVIDVDDMELLSIEVSNGDTALLDDAINRLEKLRIIERSENDIMFINFSKRQYSKPSDTPERVKERVTKHRQQNRNADVTPCNAMKRHETPSVTPTEQNRTDTDQNRSDSSSCSKEVTPPSDTVWFARLTDYWDNNYYIMGPSEREFLSGAVDSGFEYPLIQKALEIGIAQNRRTIRYVDGILRNWEQQGVKTLERWQQVESQKQAERTSRGGGSRGTHRSSTGQSPGRYDEFVERPEE